jgi:serine/threonine protein phosphatase PrpC
MSPGVRLRAYGRSDIGRVRSNNEDAFLVTEVFGPRQPSGEELTVGLDERGAVALAVSDGMGGEVAGEVASALTLHSLHAALAQLLPSTSRDVALRGGFEFANRSVANEGLTSKRGGMGATLTAALITAAHAYLSTVGDSRAYLFRCGRLLQLTRDQSYVQLLIDGGMLRPEDADRFPLRNVILQAIGRAPALSIVINRLALRRGDRLLLCSDGLSGEIKDEAIAGLMAGTSALEETSRVLIEAANAAGGNDNITVVLAAVDGEALPAPSDEDPMMGTLEDLRAK